MKPTPTKPGLVSEIIGGGLTWLFFGSVVFGMGIGGVLLVLGWIVWEVVK